MRAGRLQQIIEEGKSDLILVTSMRRKTNHYRQCKVTLWERATKLAACQQSTLIALGDLNSGGGNEKLKC